MGFWRQFCRQSSLTGAVTPSSRYLARAMVRPLRRHRQTARGEPLRVVEMGPGTGAVTCAIAQFLRPGDSLDCYEIDVGFANYLRQRVANDGRFDAVRESIRVHATAAQTARLDERAHFVICSVPLNNFEPATVHEIFGAGTRLLKGRGWFTYFEYVALPSLKRLFARPAEGKRIDGVRRAKRQYGARGVETDVVWANIPPARAVHRRLG